MGGQSVDVDDHITQYIIAIYFVTTTLSTCGFGDISATKRDAVESATILFFTIRRNAFLLYDYLKGPEFHGQ